MYKLEDFTEYELFGDKNEEYNYYIFHKNYNKTLVLLPGSFGNQFAFKEMLGYLDEKYNIIIINTPGHKNSYKAYPDGSIEYFASLAIKAVKHTDITEFYAAGHSLGGMIAIELLKQVRKVNSLTLKGIIPLEGWTYCSVIKTAFNGLKNETLTKDEIEKRTAVANKATANWTPEEKSKFAEIWLRWNGYDILLNSQTPILEVWGDRALFDKPTKEQLQIPDKKNIKIEWIPNGGHSFLIQYPKIIAETISAFIDAN